jgi:hypothetical protein
VRNFESEIVAPKPHGADQAFALAGGLLPGLGGLRGDLRVERLLARLIELVHAAAVTEPLGELGRRLGGGYGLIQEAGCFSRGDRTVVGAA